MDSERSLAAKERSVGRGCTQRWGERVCSTGKEKGELHCLRTKGVAKPA